MRPIESLCSPHGWQPDDPVECAADAAAGRSCALEGAPQHPGSQRGQSAGGWTEIDAEWFRGRLPVRRRDTNKNDYGRVLAVCGAEGYTGAAFFAAQAAVRTGSGIVTLCVPAQIYPILAVKLNEPVIVPYDTAAPGLEARAARADALLVGCGLGQAPYARELVLSLIRAASCPTVVDADGINALAGHIDVLRDAPQPLVLTPHAGEFSRLTGLPASPEAAAAFARQNGVFVLLKGFHSTIHAPDGTSFRVMAGNPGMAKGGSGDALAGCILSLLGQGFGTAEAVCAAAYLHSRAGDLCAASLGEYGMTPTDLLDALPAALREGEDSPPA